MGSTTTAGRPHGPDREDVLDAAARLLRDGPAALSMRRLAEDLGCSYQVVYSRVGGKHDLVRALHDRGFDQLTSEAARVRDAARAAGASPDGVVEQVALGYLDHAVSDPVLFEATVTSRTSGAATALAWQLWAAVHGIATVHLAGHPSPSGDPRDDVREVVRLLLRAATPGEGIGRG